METQMRAIEVEGTVDEEGRLHIDEPLTALGPGRVRVIVLSSDEEEAQEREWLSAAARSPAFDFLKDAAEDIYTLTDGKPFRDEG